jgi:hypothetical protein
MLLSRLVCLLFQAFAAMLMRYTLLWDITQRRVVILYRRFGTTSHHQASRSPRSLTMRPIRCPETSVKDYYPTLRVTPEVPRPHCMPLSITIIVCHVSLYFFIPARFNLKLRTENYTGNSKSKGNYFVDHKQS